MNRKASGIRVKIQVTVGFLVALSVAAFILGGFFGAWVVTR